ncbi:phage/plasmid replication protein [Orbus wheelerorum]|uniref:phage/plasmid replication domain-containing protein n=1 Tax=Orbus wheelerorum TaxID=3074111 RepID=UPI00370D1291
MSGNPSRWGRLENLFGLRTVDNCVSVFNQILNGLNLPNFTKCTKLMARASKGSKIDLISDGATIKELHITSNRIVGKGNVNDYLAGLSTLNYRNSVSRLHSDGNTVDWLSKLGFANLIYPCVYNKGYEIQRAQQTRRPCMHGQTLDFNKRHLQCHRARLRKIGIDIAQRCNLAKFSPVTVREIRQVQVSDCPVPKWYQMPQIFKVA